MLKGDRREQKRRKAWYKRHQKNNRKALEILIEIQRKRIRDASKQTTSDDN
jgi:hypothetical protein